MSATETSASGNACRVTIVGGGLAGMAAAAALTRSGCQVELIEARSRLGGRAGSFLFEGELVDHCQHVSMRCCTNLDHFCKLTGIADCFAHFPIVWFLDESGHRAALRATPGLPAPGHLGRSFLQMRNLSTRDRLAIARSVWKLARTPPEQLSETESFADWLAAAGQTPAAIRHWWQVVMVSALSETLDRISIRYARKVMLDGFLATRDAHTLAVPKVSLDELYGQRVASWLTEQGVSLRLGTPVKMVAGTAGVVTTLHMAGGVQHPVDYLILALPWRPASRILSEELQVQLDETLQRAREIPSSPITAVHLWFDREILDLPHAVITGRLSQWIFARADQMPEGENPRHYYQVVISASAALEKRESEDIVAEVVEDLRAVLPASRTAKLIQAKVITQPEAVFSVVPGIDKLRPSQTTPVRNLFLAGDWTQTQWPATMEGAVRSGYLAAEAVFSQLGRPRVWLQPDLPRATLSQLFFPR